MTKLEQMARTIARRTVGPDEDWSALESACLQMGRAVIAETNQAINDEPELPGEMPLEMWDAIRSDKEAAEETFRIIVRQTKSGILTRLQSLDKQDAKPTEGEER